MLAYAYTIESVTYTGILLLYSSNNMKIPHLGFSILLCFILGEYNLVLLQRCCYGQMIINFVTTCWLSLFYLITLKQPFKQQLTVNVWALSFIYVSIILLIDWSGKHIVPRLGGILTRYKCIIYLKCCSLKITFWLHNSFDLISI